MVVEKPDQSFLDGDISVGNRRPVILDVGRERLGGEGRLCDVVGDVGHAKREIQVIHVLEDRTQGVLGRDGFIERM